MSAERAGPRRWARLVLALIVLALLALVSQLELGGLERSVNRLEASHAAPAPPGEHERGGGGGGSGGGDGVHTSAGTSQSELEAEIEAEVGPEAEAEAAGLPTGYECFKSAVRNFRVHGRKRMNAFTIVSATRCVIRVEINRKFTYVGPQGAALPLVEFDLCLAARLLEVLRARPSLFWDGGFPSNEGCDWGAVRHAQMNYSTLHEMYVASSASISRGRVPGFDGKAHAGRYKRHATCALVGGAPGLLAADYGQSIDAHDAVVRFNDHPAGGEHTAQVGLRTTHRLTNCVYASMPVSESAALPWMRPSALNGSEIVQVCTRAHRFKLAVEQIAHDGPQHRHAISPETLCGFYEHFQTGGLTGAIGVWFVLGMCESVTLFGFSSPCDLGTPYSHYHSSDKFFELLQVNTVKVILWTHALRCAGLLHWALPHNASDACGAARSVLATDSVPPRAGGAGGPVGDAGMHVPKWKLPSAEEQATEKQATAARQQKAQQTAAGAAEGGEGAGVPRSALGEGVTLSVEEALALPAAGWRLHVHAFPFAAFNLSAAKEQEYWQRVREEETPPGFDEGGMYQAVVRELPRLLEQWQPPAHLPRTADATWAAANVLHLLPLSPLHFCSVADEAWTARVWTSQWMRAKGVVPVHQVESIKAAYADGLASFTITCPAFESALRWLYSQPAWRAAPERHVFVHALPHLPRVALESDVQATGGARSVYAQMGKGILIAAEDRRYDWQAALFCGRVVLSPLHSPSLFLLAPLAKDAASLGVALAGKDTLVAASHFVGVKCHRFDDALQPLLWQCADFAAQNARVVRGACSSAMQALGKALPPSPPSALAAVRELPTTRKDTANARKLAATLAEKAHLYRRSVFCLIAPGDSVVTVRIASAAAALCIPVLLFPRAFLPFAQSVAWANVSLHLDAEALVEYANDPRGRRNPLLALHELATREPKRLRAMQLALADARWLLHYRSGGRPVQGAPEPPSAGDALVQQLVRAAKQRLRAARGGTDAGACGKATLGDITLYRR